MSVRAAAILLALSRVASPAVAQEDCNIPDLILHLGEIAYIDHNGEGPTPGDNRILTHSLFSENGEEVGVVHAMSTILHSPSQEGTTIYVKGVFYFDDGKLYWANTQTLANPLDKDTSTADQIETVVTGGTGAYQNARGVFFLSPIEQNQYSLQFDIFCAG
ncbi:MAG: hypothetical protein AAGI44_03945 [Pseudomonadota bacterium]